MGIELHALPLTQTLRDRLRRWAAGDFHLAYDYEGEDRDHEEAWHVEGLALLREVRSELGAGCDVKFAHDLDA